MSNFASNDPKKGVYQNIFITFVACFEVRFDWIFAVHPDLILAKNGCNIINIIKNIKAALGRF